MKRATKMMAVAVALTTGVWLIENVRLGGVVLVPIAIVLVVYFDWRAKVVRESLADRNEPRQVA